MKEWPSTMGPWTRDHFFGQFWKLGFCSVRECLIFAHRDQLCKFIDCEHVASVSTWNLPKHAYATHRKPFLMHGFHSMPRVGIQQVSLKACRRWDSTCHRMMIISWIDELLGPLDSGHMGPWTRDHFFGQFLETRVLLSKGMSNFFTWGSSSHIARLWTCG